MSLKSLLFGLYVTLGSHHYSSNVSQEKGEQQLFELVKKSSVEEAWYFVETDKKKQWYEAGIIQTPESVEIDSRVKDEINGLKNIKRIVAYHIHPYRDEKDVCGPSLGDLLSNYYSTKMYENIAYESRVFEINGFFSITSIYPEDNYTAFEKSGETVKLSLDTPRVLCKDHKETEYAKSMSTENIRVTFIPK